MIIFKKPSKNEYFNAAIAHLTFQKKFLIWYDIVIITLLKRLQKRRKHGKRLSFG